MIATDFPFHTARRRQYGDDDFLRTTGGKHAISGDYRNKVIPGDSAV